MAFLPPEAASFLRTEWHFGKIELYYITFGNFALHDNDV